MSVKSTHRMMQSLDLLMEDLLLPLEEEEKKVVPLPLFFIIQTIQH